MILAPIILFVYNRPEHTRKALEAISDNEEAASSTLYIYADGPKTDASGKELEQLQQTRAILNARKWCKDVIIICSEVNKGLANSIIDGTTEILNKWQRVITVEDDVVVGRFFLKFMNEALDRYAANEKAFMISGYNFPVPEHKANNSCFFIPAGTSQAWGTWKSKWEMFDREAKGYEVIKTDKEIRKQFNLDNSHDFAAMLESQMETGKVNSWAIRYRWSLFTHKGLTLFPDHSLIKNIGWDGSGTHSGTVNLYEEKNWNKEYKILDFPTQVISDDDMFRFHKDYLKRIAASKNKKRGLKALLSKAYRKFK